MGTRGSLRILYPQGLHVRARDGRHAMTNRIVQAFRGAGFDVTFAEDTLVERLRTRAAGAHSIVHATDPVDSRGLVLRRAYVGAFWRLEPTEKRWDFDVARQDFDPASVDGDEALRFLRRWRAELFGAATMNRTEGDRLFIPLQGRLLDHRRFQTMSPLAMVEAVCRARPTTPVVATLHPKYAYTPAERDGLGRLAQTLPNLSLSEVRSDRVLHHCAAVVCQNSAVAFTGYFLGVPAVLFARIDFHHIAAKVEELGVEGALSRLSAPAPDTARYLWWFLKKNAIGAGSDGAEEQILAAARRAGWQV
ncbi:hypothetical protein ACRDNQ_08110 [Palleronia sp. KMU-117]|uniref:hypothetical protein n=1 Tax=Palleronia sp. KMU-117 TaxID=3434108 RepID=UPI003D74BE3B